MEILGYIASIFIGILLGSIGGGGSILTVPVLVYLFDISPVTATSYSLFVVGISSLAGVILKVNTGSIRPKTAMLFSSTSMMTVFITRKFIIPEIPLVLFRVGNFEITQAMATMLLFAILMIFSAFSMIRKRGKGPGDTASYLYFGQLSLYGIGIGLVTGLLGAGGGFLIIPVLVLLCGLKMKEAIGTSLLIITCNSLVGFFADLDYFNIDWKLLTLVTGLAVLGILVGLRISKNVNNEQLKKIFGWFVLLMGVYIIVKEFISHM